MPSLSCTLTPEEGEKAGPKVTRVGELSMPSLGASLRRTSPAPNVGSTIETTPLAEVCMCQLLRSEKRIPSPTPHLPYGGMGWRKMPSHHPSIPEAGGRADLVVIREEALC